MLLPVGKERPKELSTSYTRFDQLLQDLFESRFSGYIRLAFWGYEGVIIIDNGRMIQAYYVEKEKFFRGEEAILNIITRAEQPDGTIEVHHLNNEIAIALAVAIQADVQEAPVQKKMLSEVFEQISRENKHGYVDIQFSGKRGFGTVYFLDGIPVESVIMSNSGKIASGKPVLQRILEVGKNIQPHVQIYFVREVCMLDQDRVLIIPWVHQKYLEFWSQLLQYFSQRFGKFLKRTDFQNAFQEACRTMQKQFPILDENKGIIQFSELRIHLTKIIYHPAFLNAMENILRYILMKMPGRKRRKINFNEIINDVETLCRQFDIHPKKFDGQKFVLNLIEGIIE